MLATGSQLRIATGRAQCRFGAVARAARPAVLLEEPPIADSAVTPARAGALADRLDDALDGEVRFDRFTRGLYSTDASIYQITPLGVAFPTSASDVIRAVEIAGESGVPITPRGAGTSMSGQSIGTGLVLDTSRALTAIREFDPGGRRIVVEPGIVLDDLNRFLAPHGLFFPIDVATSSRATLGGMAGNNSAGARSIRYGHMVEQVLGIEGVLADGRLAWFGPSLAPGGGVTEAPAAPIGLHTALQSIYARESEELARRLPRVPRHVAGYALHRLGRPGATLADILVGSEGTLSIFTALELKLSPLPGARVLGVCRFGSVRDALAAVPAIVGLGPAAVELVDRILLDLALEIPALGGPLRRMLAIGEGGAGDGPELPGAVLIVEFDGPDEDAAARGLPDLEEVARQAGSDGVLWAIDPAHQSEVWEIRKAGLNIATSVRAPRRPIAFIEDCVIPLGRLAEWYDRLTEVIDGHDTEAIWYAHASVGCLHVRPALDLKDPDDVRRMRAIAQDAFAIARDLGGSHSGEHGDGIIRSEFTRAMLGNRLAEAFEEVKAHFDPGSLLNPGKVVNAPAMDDRSLFRYSPSYHAEPFDAALDWSHWGGLLGAVEMCNNNGACRKRDPGVMCPSYRATLDERHSTRGRANALRLALTGQLGDEVWGSPELRDAMDLCIGCKACRRECPTGVDMARMKIEYLRRYRDAHRLTPGERAVAYLPRLAPWVSRVPNFANSRNLPGPVGRLMDRVLDLAPDRPLPRWAGKPFRPPRRIAARKGRSPYGDPRKGSPRVALFVDTFTRYFEPENARAAIRVLEAAGFGVEVPDGGRPVCCGRTFLNAGLVEEARTEMDRVVSQYVRYADGDVPIVGLEPSCVLTLRDELVALRPGPGAEIVANQSRLFSELVLDEGLDRLPLSLPAGEPRRAYVHGHCHEKAFGVDRATIRVLESVPELGVESIRAGCCGMAGSFGYEAKHADLSRRIGELDLAPAVRQAPADAWIVANGTSCRHQIRDLTGREALHLAVVLDRAVRGDAS